MSEKYPQLQKKKEKKLMRVEQLGLKAGRYRMFISCVMRISGRVDQCGSGFSYNCFVKAV